MDRMMQAQSGLPQIVENDRPEWKSGQFGPVSYWYAGDRRSVERLAGLLAKAFDNAPALSEALNASAGSFAMIAATSEHMFACVDHCRSFPVFHTIGPQVYVGTDAAATLAASGVARPDMTSALECAMSGYSTGPHTLYENLKQLEPGQALLWRRSDGKCLPLRYFRYLPGDIFPASEAELQDRLDAVVNQAIDRTIVAADGAPIVIPLSGGLDSRLILAKLHARNYRNLHCFSYGQAGNADAMVARDIADHLGVSWRFVPTPGRVTRQFFNSSLRRDYWQYADALSAVPNNQDILPLQQLRAQAGIPADAMIVNGQTGDFISGGHIPELLFQLGLSAGDLVSRISERHYSLWASLRIPANQARIAERIRSLLELDAEDSQPLGQEQAIALWERFEYEGRQARYIVNGQRVYDHLGYRWQLPLWDADLVHFWRDVPTAFKRRQKLYRDTWRRWDYERLFSRPTRAISAWSKPVSAFIIPLSVMARLLLGRQRRDRMIGYARYIDRFGNHYQSFGWKAFARVAPDIRNPVALYARAWLEERGFAAIWDTGRPT